jgi:hypothetical protein
MTASDGASPTAEFTFGQWTPEEYAELLRCQRCHARGDREGDIRDDVCSRGCCLIWRCANCGHSDSSAGPVGCRHHPPNGRAADARRRRVERWRRRRTARPPEDPA